MNPTIVCPDPTQPLPDIDIGQVIDIYDRLNTRIRKDLDADYDCKKINGMTYADTWSKLMSTVISSALQSVVSVQNKETPSDRAIKCLDIDVKKEQIAASRVNSDNATAIAVSKINVDNEQITASGIKTSNETCIAVSTCDLKTKQGIEIEAESARKELTTAEQIEASEAKTQDSRAMTIANVAKADAEKELIEAKEKAEDIKNGDAVADNSLYGKNIAAVTAQESLYQRQRTGFSDNARQKVLDSQLSAWSVAWKDVDAFEVPLALNNDAIQSAVDSVNNEMGKDA